MGEGVWGDTTPLDSATVCIEPSQKEKKKEQKTGQKSVKPTIQCYSSIARPCPVFFCFFFQK